jgi:predicted amidohydrolase YtcJ
MASTPDLILHHGIFTTLDRARPQASAVAIKDGRFLRVGSDAEIMPLAGPSTRVIDLQGRPALPGLCDNHTHIIRGGLNFNMELRWDGVRSLADAMGHAQAPGGGDAAAAVGPRRGRLHRASSSSRSACPRWTSSIAVAPDTPVFILHLYDRALLNRAALRAVGYTRTRPNRRRADRARRRGQPTGLLLAKPNAAILYATLAKGPKLPLEYQVNSTRHFMRELNRLGITSVIDAGGGFQNYPEDYDVVQRLADAGS